MQTFHMKKKFDYHEDEPVVGTNFYMNGFALVLIFIVLIKWYLPLLLENGKRYFIRYPNACT